VLSGSWGSHVECSPTGEVRIDLAPYATPTALAVAVRYWSQAIGGAMRIRTARLAEGATPITSVVMVASSYQYGPERLALVSSELDELSIAHEETVDTYCDSPLDPARRTAASDGFYEDGLDDEGHGMRRREGLVREGSFEASSAVPNGGDGVVFRSATSAGLAVRLDPSTLLTREPPTYELPVPSELLERSATSARSTAAKASALEVAARALSVHLREQILRDPRMEELLAKLHPALAPLQMWEENASRRWRRLALKKDPKASTAPVPDRRAGRRLRSRWRGSLDEDETPTRRRWSTPMLTDTRRRDGVLRAAPSARPLSPTPMR